MEGYINEPPYITLAKLINYVNETAHATERLNLPIPPFILYRLEECKYRKGLVTPALWFDIKNELINKAFRLYRPFFRVSYLYDTTRERDIPTKPPAAREEFPDDKKEIYYDLLELNFPRNITVHALPWAVEWDYVDDIKERNYYRTDEYIWSLSELEVLFKAINGEYQRFKPQEWTWTPWKTELLWPTNIQNVGYEKSIFQFIEQLLPDIYQGYNFIDYKKLAAALVSLIQRIKIDEDQTPVDIVADHYAANIVQIVQDILSAGYELIQQSKRWNDRYIAGLKVRICDKVSGDLIGHSGDPKGIGESVIIEKYKDVYKKTKKQKGHNRVYRSILNFLEEYKNSILSELWDAPY